MSIEEIPGDGAAVLRPRRRGPRGRPGRSPPGPREDRGPPRTGSQPTRCAPDVPSGRRERSGSASEQRGGFVQGSTGIVSNMRAACDAILIMSIKFTIPSTEKRMVPLATAQTATVSALIALSLAAAVTPTAATSATLGDHHQQRSHRSATPQENPDGERRGKAPSCCCSYSQ